MAATYRNTKLGIEVQVTRPAAKLIGPEKVTAFVKVLTDLMDHLGAEWAYVGKSGLAVSVDILRRDGWRGYLNVGSKE